MCRTNECGTRHQRYKADPSSFSSWTSFSQMCQHCVKCLSELKNLSLIRTFNFKFIPFHTYKNIPTIIVINICLLIPLVKYNFWLVLLNPCVQSWQIWHNEVQDEKLYFVNQNQCHTRIFTTLNYAKPIWTNMCHELIPDFSNVSKFLGSNVLVNKLLLTPSFRLYFQVVGAWITETLTLRTVVHMIPTKVSASVTVVSSTQKEINATVVWQITTWILWCPTQTWPIQMESSVKVTS